MKTATDKKIQPGYEPISGYVLEELIGQGGYGEVWRAEAPGGLKKAVKFVFGQHDEKRASQELKSLERIKSVQHPFILTLERFELIDNQLVIVTELADGSLEDVFKQHTQRGSCGIPRENLLDYMRDAADALDYLHQLYQLQHLDIKPGNLLIVGGHVKVADFGLLKDLGEADCSLVGGLTPIYAPPEVFDGRPSMRSDQYSLAVMYQELLTGRRPFTGRTIAQLATQHVHNAPNLESLPPTDRPIVARALEKSPDRRFNSCKEFVAKLISPRGTSAPNHQQEPPTDTAVDSTAHQVEDLPQLEPSQRHKFANATRRALVIALGGAGSEVLNLLRRRVSDLRSTSPVTIHSVLLDTNQKTIQTARMIEPLECLPKCHAVATPLRHANDYRQLGTGKLQSVSRRWIYNIPRSGTTEGMRPLGRLAMLDHADKIKQTLTQAITDVTSTGDPENLSVYVVGSLAGGTGSGMYLDIVHLIRYLMDEAGLEGNEVISLLVTNRLQGDPSRVLGLHGTRSALSEMMHFMKPGNGYPGDPGTGWPSIPSSRSPLHNAYLISKSEHSSVPAPTEIATEYLWADATDCGELLSSGRALVDLNDNAVQQPQIRSACVVCISDQNRVQTSMLAPPTSRLLLLKWLGEPKQALTAAQPVVQRLLRRCYLRAEPWVNQTLNWFGKDRLQRRAALMEHLRGVSMDRLRVDSLAQAECVKWLNSVVHVESSQITVQNTMQNIHRELAVRLQDGRLDLAATLECLKILIQHVSQVVDQLVKISETPLPASPSNQTAGSRDGERSEPNTGALRHLRAACDRGELLMYSVAARLGANTASTIRSELQQLEQALSDGATKVAMAINLLADGRNVKENPWETMPETIQGQFDSIFESLHAKASHWLVSMIGPKSSSISAEEMKEGLNALAVQTIGQFLQQLTAGGGNDADGRDATTLMHDSSVCTETATLDGHSGDTSVSNGTRSFSEIQSARSVVMNMGEAVAVVRPPLLRCGGKQRLFLIGDSEEECQRLESEIRQSHEGSLTTFVAQSVSPILIHEAQQIPLSSVLQVIGAASGDDGRISKRLHGRTDITFDGS